MSVKSHRDAIGNARVVARLDTPCFVPAAVRSIRPLRQHKETEADHGRRPEKCSIILDESRVHLRCQLTLSPCLSRSTPGNPKVCKCKNSHCLKLYAMRVRFFVTFHLA